MSHLRAEVRNPAAAHGHLTSAVFGSPRQGFEFTDLAPPIGFVPLDMARSFRDPPPPGIGPFTPVPFWEQRLEVRGALGHAPWEDYQPGQAEHGTWYRMDEPPILADGTLDPLALIVMADTMPGAVGEKLGPQHRQGWFGPSVDLTFHLLGSCRSEWVFAHNLPPMQERGTPQQRWRSGTSVRTATTRGAWLPTPPKCASSASHDRRRQPSHVRHGTAAAWTTRQLTCRATWPAGSRSRMSVKAGQTHPAYAPSARTHSGRRRPRIEPHSTYPLVSGTRLD